eukprot:TRINITY_DN97492_c0_g1_i1.p2 TRINITY_DN97492_c0_g1~~TRINITY_DN97492_c0_g1_i1.p2  ORF type:complete len:104 (+),score=8.24 TRINITY_DN97492_c0_g1_i1:48-314(+)
MMKYYCDFFFFVFSYMKKCTSCKINDKFFQLILRITWDNLQYSNLVISHLDTMNFLLQRTCTQVRGLLTENDLNLGENNEFFVITHFF